MSPLNWIGSLFGLRASFAMMWQCPLCGELSASKRAAHWHGLSHSDEEYRTAVLAKWAARQLKPS